MVLRQCTADCLRHVPYPCVGRKTGLTYIGLPGRSDETNRTVLLSAEGAEGRGVGEGLPSPLGEGSREGLYPSPEIFFIFRSRNGVVWCICMCH
jgi:hypothetical protein